MTRRETETLHKQVFPPKIHQIFDIRDFKFHIKFLAHRNRSDFCDLRLRCPSRTPEIARFPRQEKVMLHCDLRVRWKVASDLRFRAAISEPKTPSFCGISGDLAPSTRKSLAIAIVRFWCAKIKFHQNISQQTCAGMATLRGSLWKQATSLVATKKWDPFDHSEGQLSLNVKKSERSLEMGSRPRGAKKSEKS